GVDAERRRLARAGPIRKRHRGDLPGDRPGVARRFGRHMGEPLGPEEAAPRSRRTIWGAGDGCDRRGRRSSRGGVVKEVDGDSRAERTDWRTNAFSKGGKFA